MLFFIPVFEHFGDGGGADRIDIRHHYNLKKEAEKAKEQAPPTAA